MGRAERLQERHDSDTAWTVVQPESNHERLVAEGKLPRYVHCKACQAFILASQAGAGMPHDGHTIEDA